eukprot:966195_1
MNGHSRSHSCIYTELSNKLYSIGGLNKDPLNTIEVISIADMSGNWQYIDNLTVKAAYARSVLYESDIFVMGMYGTITINVIDTLHDTVSLGASLAFKGNGLCAIIVNNVIYSFGCNIASGSHQNSDGWQYYTEHGQ